MPVFETEDVQGASSTVSRALRLIEDGALDHANIDALCERLGIGARQLRRLFHKHLGKSRVFVARTSLVG
jgi:AraC family transcriptional regulator of adaptative response / DNA-3-methyladenine glycosylase II